MTDNPQQPWQPGTPPPPPSNIPGQYADQPTRSPEASQGAPQQGGWQNQPQGAPNQGDWQSQPQQAYQGQQLASGDERTWMLLAHLSAPIAAVVSLGWLSFVGPLVVWLMRKEDSRAVRTAAAGAFNFNLAFWLMNIVAWICLFTVILIPVAIIIWVIIWPVAIYAHLRGAWLASKGRVYTYPFQLRVLS